MTVQFDTLKAVKALKHAGFDDVQAEAVVETVGGAIEDNVASKTDVQRAEERLGVKIAAVQTDLRETEGKLTARIDQVEGKLMADVADVKASMAEQFRDLYKHLWVVAASIVTLIVTLTVALTKLL